MDNEYTKYAQNNAIMQFVVQIITDLTLRQLAEVFFNFYLSSGPALALGTTATI